jgi:hypothetical protein
MESSTMTFLSILLGNLMENSGDGENMKTIAKLVELSRLIRLNITGATSYQHLRMVDGVI